MDRKKELFTFKGFSLPADFSYSVISSKNYKDSDMFPYMGKNIRYRIMATLDSF